MKALNNAKFLGKDPTDMKLAFLNGMRIVVAAWLMYVHCISLSSQIESFDFTRSSAQENGLIRRTMNAV